MNPELKLNYKRTFYIGFTFFSILMIWQLYNHYCPLFLEILLAEKFEGQSERMYYIIGAIMAADNFFAIFMLPIFGTLSDRTKTKMGRRMPYIVFGMLASAILFPLIAVMFIQRTLVGLIVMMGVILIIMNIYRNPAVALMPDVTPKPLRSKANGIINFVGYLGAILAGGLAMFLKEDNPVNPLIAFLVGSFFLVLAIILLTIKIKENQIVSETRKEMELGEKLSQTLEEVREDKPLNKEDKRNMFILIASVLFWFVSFNAIETFNSLFCEKVLGSSSYNGTIVIILTVSSILTFLASMNLPNKIGRKNTVLIGLGLIILGFIGILLTLYLGGIYNPEVTEPKVSLVFIYLMIVLCGIGWALINANSYPMMVEMSNKNNVGKYTGYYYTSSMFAQTLTPALVGLIMSFNIAGLKLLYIYSLITMVIALVIFSFFKENKLAVKRISSGFESLDHE